MSTQENVVVQVEKVNKNPKPPFDKFNSGGICVDGKWLNTAKKLDINSFESGKTYEVVIETNDKGYKTVTKNITAELNASEPIPATLKQAVATPQKANVDWAAKDRSMLIGGMMHDAATLCAPNAQGLTVKQIAEMMREMMLELVLLRDEIK